MGLTRTYPIDTALQLEDAITATEVNSGGEIDLGDGLAHGAVVINLSAIKVSSNDEDYKIELQGSTISGFATETANVVLATLHLGANEVTGAVPGDTTTDTAVGQYYVPFCNDFAGTTHRYVRLKVTTTGTSETLTYTAHLTTQRTMG